MQLSAATDTKAYKQFYKSQLDRLMTEKTQQKQHMQQVQEHQRQLYNQRLRQFGQMEQLKDQTYKDYYRSIMANQGLKHQRYTSPFYQSDIKKQQHIQTAVKEQKIRDKLEEMERMRRNQAIIQDFQNGLKVQMDSKKMVENLQKNQKIRENEFLEQVSLSPRKVDIIELARRREAEVKYKEDLDKIMVQREANHLKSLKEDHKAYYPTNSPQHNPLYNPLPFNVQNPYILKDMQRRSSSSNSYLANVASSNLTQRKQY